jgi:hypothetical protein
MRLAHPEKKWHYQPWEKRGSIYFQQSVYTTALVISYGRPFTRGAGWPALPKRLQAYTEAERKLHERLLRLRNKIYAHSDSDSYSIIPYINRSFTTDIVKVPTLKLDADETNQFIEMTEKIMASIEERMQQLRSESEAATT